MNKKIENTLRIIMGSILSIFVVLFISITLIYWVVGKEKAEEIYFKYVSVPKIERAIENNYPIHESWIEAYNEFKEKGEN